VVLKALAVLAAVILGRAIAATTSECLGAGVHTSDHCKRETGLLDEGKRIRTNIGNERYN
jgi:hypothetical protein